MGMKALAGIKAELASASLWGWKFMPASRQNRPQHRFGDESSCRHQGRTGLSIALDRV